MIEFKFENNDKHLKGYIFDSLVYRYKDAQTKAYFHEVAMMKSEKGMSQYEAEMRVRTSQNRDLMRFIEILNEAIGEHD